MTAEEERAAIVAWLRDNYNLHQTNPALAIFRAASLIENGDHLRDKSG